jgi:hypothetical protein
MYSILFYSNCEKKVRKGAYSKRLVAYYIKNKDKMFQCLHQKCNIFNSKYILYLIIKQLHSVKSSFKN